MTKKKVTKRVYVWKFLTSFFIGYFAFIIVAFFLLPDDANGNLIDQPFINELICMLTFILTFIIGAILQWFSLNKRVFYEEEKTFIYEKGIFFKKRVVIQYHLINAISIQRSIFDLLTGTSKLKIDTSSIFAIEKEVTLQLKKTDALKLKEYLEQKQTELPNSIEEEIVEFVKVQTEDKIFRTKNSSIFLMGVINEGFLSMLLALILFFPLVLQFLYINKGKNDYDISFNIILLVFVVLISFILIIKIVSKLFKYYNYKVTINSDSLEYQYGLLSKHLYSSSISKISSFKISQPLLYRLFKKYSLSVTITGIGETNDKDNQDNFSSRYLLPIGSKEELKILLKHLGLDDFSGLEFEQSKRFINTNFIIVPILTLTLLMTLAVFGLKDLMHKYYLSYLTIGLIYIFGSIGLVLRRFNQGLNLNNNVVVRNGSYTINYQLIKINNIVSVSKNAGPIRTLTKTNNITLYYNYFMGRITLVNYDKNTFNGVKDKLLK